MAKALGLIVVAALSILTLMAEVKLDTLWIDASPLEAETPSAKVFFFRDGAVDSEAPAITHKVGDNVNMFVKMPEHYRPNGIFIDLGTKPDTWEINRVYFRSRFLIFRVEAYEWTRETSKALSANYLANSEILESAGFSVKTTQWPYRFYHSFDYDKLRSSTDLTIAKAITIAALIGVYLLLISGYFWRLFSTRAEDADALRQSHQFVWSSYRGILVASGAVLFVLMCLLGSTNILYPGLYIEDSMEFSDALAGNLSLFDASTYVYYRGYQVFLSEWFVAGAGLFPMELQPYLYVLIGITVAWLAMLAMASTGLIRHPIALALAPFALFLGSFNVPAMFLTLTGTFFSSTALLMAMAVRPAPSNLLPFGLSFLLMCALAWSGPYAAQILPLSFALLCWASSGRKSFLLIALMVVALLYTKGSASGMVQFENLIDPAIRSHFYDSVVQHIFLFGLAPVQEFTTGLVVIGLIVLLLVVFRSDRLYVKHSLIFLMSTLVSLMTYFISFKYHQYAGELISAHLIIPQFTWMAFVVISFDRLLRAAPRGWQRSAASTALVMALGLLFYGKKTHEAQREKLLPDHNLNTFIKSVRYAKEMPLAEKEFIQLWDVNHQGYVTSFRRGYEGDDEISVDVERFPEEFQLFVLPLDLERKDNMLLQYLPTSQMWYSDQTFRDIPRDISQHHRKALRLH